MLNIRLTAFSLLSFAAFLFYLAIAISGKSETGDSLSPIICIIATAVALVGSILLLVSKLRQVRYRHPVRHPMVTAKRQVAARISLPLECAQSKLTDLASVQLDPSTDGNPL